MFSDLTTSTSNNTALRLNAFYLQISGNKFQAFIQPLLDTKELKPLREAMCEWFLYWKDGLVYGIPRISNPAQDFGKPQMFSVSDYLGLAVLNARANDLIPNLLPKYDPVKMRYRRGFRFLAKKVELVRDIINRWANVPIVVHGFKIRPRFACETRLVELRPGELQIVVVLGVEMHWSVECRIEALSAAGINLAGFHVIRDRPAEGQRRLVGRIDRIENGKVVLGESYEGSSAIDANELQLEGSRFVFAHCLKNLLGGRFDVFEEQREQLEADFLTGGGLDHCLGQFSETFRKTKPLQLVAGVTAAVGEQVNLRNDANFQTTVQLDPVEYCYDAAKTKRHQFAWEGLQEYGPYSRESFPKRSPRVLVVCPDVAQIRIEQALRHLKNGIPNSRFKGFERVFNLINVDFVFCTVPLRNVQSSETEPALLYRQHVENCLAADGNFEAALVIVLDEHANLPDKVSPYLFTKALLLTNGIPVQEARVSTLTRRVDSLQFVLQSLSVALYAKMGGTPWTVNQDVTVNDEIVIGMGMVEVSGNRFAERQRHVGITTVFRGDGNYLLGNISKECLYDDYPKILQETVANVVDEIRQRNGWRPRDTVRIVFHASKPLRHLEVDELVRKCVKEAAPEQNVEFAFIDVLHDHSFRIFDYREKGRRAADGGIKGQFVPKRGLTAYIGKNTRLLSTNGPSQIKRSVTPLPAPLLVHLHPHSTGCDLTYLTDQVLKFTSLTWRSVQPAYAPVTIYYSELIAGLLLRLKHVPGWSAVPLNTKLRSSKWFL
jgi:Piwi domain